MESRSSHSELEYGGFWIRFAASLVDSIILTFLISILLYIFYDSTELVATNVSLMLSPSFLLVNYLLPTLAIIILWHFKAATPGKMLFRLEIVDAKTLQKPSFKQSIFRFLGYFVSTLPLCLGFIWIAFDARKQGWHDKIAHTIVIKRRSL